MYDLSKYDFCPRSFQTFEHVLSAQQYECPVREALLQMGLLYLPQSENDVTKLPAVHACISQNMSARLRALLFRTQHGRQVSCLQVQTQGQPQLELNFNTPPPLLKKQKT